MPCLELLSPGPPCNNAASLSYLSSTVVRHLSGAKNVVADALSHLILLILRLCQSPLILLMS